MENTEYEFLLKFPGSRMNRAMSMNIIFKDFWYILTNCLPYNSFWRKYSITDLTTGGFSGGSQGKKIWLQCGRPEFDPWIRKIPWGREWLPTPVFLSEEFQGQEELRGRQSMGSLRVRHDWATNTHLTITESKWEWFFSFKLCDFFF